MCSPLRALWNALRRFLHISFVEEIKKEEELLFCEICDPRDPRALGPQYGFFGRAGSVIAGVGKGDGRGRTTRFE